MHTLKFFDRYNCELIFDIDGEGYIIPQYQRWLVKVVASSAIKPHIKVGTRLFSLDWDIRMGAYCVARENTVLQYAIKGISSKIILCDAIGSELTPYLYITPNSITEEEFAEILDRLGQIAIVHESGALAPATVMKGSDILDRGKSVDGDAFENLMHAVNDNWEAIKKNPVKEIRPAIKTLDLTKIESVKSVRAFNYAVQKPYQRRLQIMERDETYDSAENRFLVHILKDILLPKSKPLIDYFRNQALGMKRVQRQPSPRYGQSYLNLWKNRRVVIDEQVKNLERQATRFETEAEKIRKHIEEPFLEKARLSNSTLVRPSSKIAQSKEYGPVYRAYQSYINNKKPTQKKGVAWALEEKSIKPIQNLYEMWVFLEIYARLVYQFGFVPEGNNPLDLTEVVDREITLREDSKYTLVFFSPENPEKPICRILLTYTPSLHTPDCSPNSDKKCYKPEICESLPCYRRWKFLTPDISLFIEVKDISKPALVKTSKIALDVKYRNYASQKNSNYLREEMLQFQVDSLFEYDLLITAKMKYLNSLGFDAAFTLHSDPSKQYTTFGAEPFPASPIRERRMGQTYYPAHKTGAVCITPRHDDNLDKLLRCFLMYHAGLDYVCWNCHKVLTEQNGGLKKQPDIGKGNYYQCLGCGQFWISQVCGHPDHHPLIKMGRDSFHKISAQNEWNSTCPACGDAFNENLFPHGKP